MLTLEVKIQWHACRCAMPCIPSMGCAKVQSWEKLQSSCLEPRLLLAPLQMHSNIGLTGQTHASLSAKSGLHHASCGVDASVLSIHASRSHASVAAGQQDVCLCPRQPLSCLEPFRWSSCSRCTMQQEARPPLPVVAQPLLLHSQVRCAFAAAYR